MTPDQSDFMTVRKQLTFGSLFAGIGGFDLGLERAGMRCAWQVEIDPYARRVLEKHWPNVRRWDDVRTFPPSGEWNVDVIAGGFPCQPISHAGKQRGSNDARWLWPEFARVIGILRPHYVILENVPALLNRGFDAVLGDLAALGFDAEWSCISACAMGAPHMRKRLFVMAYPMRERKSCSSVNSKCREALSRESNNFGMPSISEAIWGNPDPEILRMADGISKEVDGIRVAGNAVVPQVAEWIGRCLLESISEPAV
jgi:DNA (cytosine-5)-methyltransferase 1